jgi:signal transduction histidine kinase
VKEVSCRFFEIPLRDLRERGLDASELTKGTTYSPADLARKNDRVEWSALERMMENGRQFWTTDQLLRLGERSTEGALVQFISVVARLRFSVHGFYQWVTASDGVANQMITSVRTSSKSDGPGRIVVQFEMLPGYRPCKEFFLITQGTYAAIPRMVGAPLANVRASFHARGATLDIRYREPTGWIAAARRVVTRPFVAQQAAKELADAHASLLERYNELEAARTSLEHYQQHLENLVEERTAELRDAHAARERFFGNVSHEIRTPLSLILLAVADVEAHGGAHLEERAHRSLESISEGARKLVRLVDELLILAAGQEHKLQLHREPTDLAALVDRTVAAWLPAVEAAGLRLASTAPKTMIVAIDPVAIERVASNLLSNAVKYSTRGGSIDVELVEGADGVRLSVLDTGPGIDDELAARLFGRFERAQGDDRRKAGAGIGLALVKELVEAHGGTVGAFARDGGGTEMRVVLPAEVVVRDAATAPRDRVPLDVPSMTAGIASGTVLTPPGTAAGTILLVEDDPQLAEMIAKLLSEEYTVIVALDGVDAIAQIRKHQPHLLVTDVDMPRMNGIELSREFRALTNDKMAPIVILSAVLDLGTRLAGLEAGAIDYVTKPFDPLELRARVRAQFRMRELAVRLHRAEQLSSLGILTSGLAHELRNPANGLYNAVAPLKSLLPGDLVRDGTGIAQLLDVMSACASQIASLSRQLLSFRNGGDLLEMRPSLMTELVDRASRLASRALTDIDVRTELAIEAPVVCSPQLFVQVLANLLENAGHAAGKGGWVEIHGHAENGLVTLAVADSGPGVPVELRERVFEPFFTTKPPGVGTGLGLSVARAIVQRHGGVLEIRYKGPRPAFVVELPAAKAV